MIVMLAVAIVIAFISLAYAVWVTNQRFVLEMEVASLRRQANGWADAYYEVIRGSDGSDA